MKKVSIVLLIGIVFTLVSCGGKKVRFESAKEYNDYIVKAIQDVDVAWSDAIKEKDLNRSLEKADVLGKISKESLDRLENLKTYKKDFLFRKSSIAYVKHIHDISGKELKEFLNLLHSSSPDQTRMNELIKTLDEDRESKFHLVTVSQSLFAAKYNLKLSKSTAAY